MTQKDGHHDVVWGPLASWKVGLVDGTTIVVHAHAFAVEDREYVFTVLMKGEPGYEVAVARVPSKAVLTVYGGDELTE